MLAILWLTLALVVPPTRAVAFPLSPDDPRVAAALECSRGIQHGNDEMGSYIDSAWATVSVHASGQDPHSWNKSRSGLFLVD